MLKPEHVTTKDGSDSASCLCPKCGGDRCRFSKHALFIEGRTAFACKDCGLLKQGPDDPGPLEWIPKADA